MLLYYFTQKIIDFPLNTLDILHTEGTACYKLIISQNT